MSKSETEKKRKEETTMTTREMNDRLNRLMDERFMVMMIDRWNDKDRSDYDRLTREINKLRSELEGETR